MLTSIRWINFNAIVKFYAKLLQSFIAKYKIHIVVDHFKRSHSSLDELFIIFSQFVMKICALWINFSWESA